MKHLLNYTLTEFRKELEGISLQRYRADQVFNWVYKRFELDFENMTNLQKDIRKKLKELYYPHSLELISKIVASDSTKYLFRTRDGHIVETVLIFERDHLTLCISSQIGCAVGCKFCATALDGLVRNLSAGEIIDQFIQVQKDVAAKIRNVVFMGMGEPLANYENVRKSVEIMVSPWGLDLSKRRVSVSTSGIISQLQKMMHDPLMKEINLAISINATTQTMRSHLMPISRSNTLEDLFDVLKKFPYPEDRRIMLEYVLIDGVNDSIEDAKRLASLIGSYKRKFKVNLIPFNPDPNLPYERPSMDKVLAFQKALWQHNISAFIRLSKGSEVFGACGQLRNRLIKES